MPLDVYLLSRRAKDIVRHTWSHNTMHAGPRHMQAERKTPASPLLQSARKHMTAAAYKNSSATAAARAMRHDALHAP